MKPKSAFTRRMHFTKVHTRDVLAVARTCPTQVGATTLANFWYTGTHFQTLVFIHFDPTQATHSHHQRSIQNAGTTLCDQMLVQFNIATLSEVIEREQFVGKY